MFSTIFSSGLVNSIVAIALITIISLPGSINALQTYNSFHLIEPHRKPVIIRTYAKIAKKLNLSNRQVAKNAKDS